MFFRRLLLRFLPLMRPINSLSQRQYMNAAVLLLSRAGVRVVEAPLWVAPSVKIDLFAQYALSLGEGCVISERVTILTHDYSLDRVGLARADHDPQYELYRFAPVSVGRRSFVGMGAILLPGVTIGEGSIVGAGSVVNGEVAPGTVVAGNPARVISTVNEYWEKSRGKFEIKPRRG